MSKSRQALGKRGEDLAASYLLEQGYKILTRNFRCPLGEIDIIARDRRSLIFIEVRSNSSVCYGLPQESVSARKRIKLRQVAAFYLQSQRVGLPLRFDVIGIVFDSDGRAKRFEHIENAF